MQNFSFSPSCYLRARRTKINKSKEAFQATTGESQPMVEGIEHLWTPDNFCLSIGHWETETVQVGLGSNETKQ